jgi:molybdopterin/thiamine biosynthesis adenylyltransferase
MQDHELLRYSRHILLDEIGIEGQEKFLRAHVLVVGLGGLGSVAAMYLASAGVGQLTLVDNDTVDITNLQRQIAHTSNSVGQTKVTSAAQTLRALNPQTHITALHQRADRAQLEKLVAQADLVLDCSDNFSTRHAINAACVAQRKTLVWGAAVRFDGQIGAYQPQFTDAACYACLFPWNPDLQDTPCASLGIFAPMVGIMGAMQAAEALKCIAQIGQPLTGRLLMLNGLSMQWDQLHIDRNPHCSVCAPTPSS